VSDLQSFLAPDPLDALAVDREAALLRDRMSPAIAEAGPLLGESDQPGPKLYLLIGHLGLSSLSRAVLADYLAGPALGDVEVADQVINRLSSPDRA
jgi:hypothetical protein